MAIASAHNRYECSEDCAQASGAAGRVRPGQLGRCGLFRFFATTRTSAVPATAVCHLPRLGPWPNASASWPCTACARLPARPRWVHNSRLDACRRRLFFSNPRSPKAPCPTLQGWMRAQEPAGRPATELSWKGHPGLRLPECRTEGQPAEPVLRWCASPAVPTAAQLRGAFAPPSPASADVLGLRESSCRDWIKPGTGQRRACRRSSINPIPIHRQPPYAGPGPTGPQPAGHRAR